MTAWRKAMPSTELSTTAAVVVATIIKRVELSRFFHSAINTIGRIVLCYPQVPSVRVSFDCGWFYFCY